jgi:hypothetical protein
MAVADATACEATRYVRWSAADHDTEVTTCAVARAKTCPCSISRVATYGTTLATARNNCALALATLGATAATERTVRMNAASRLELATALAAARNRLLVIR